MPLNYVYVVDENVPGGANLMVEVLRRVLLHLQLSGNLPTVQPVLYFKMDNCSENKNRTMFAFLAFLVHSNVFCEIYVGFLMVGHTHEDIDQFFSVISSWLKKVGTICPDPQSLKEAIKAAFLNSKKLSSCIPAVFDILPFDVFNYDTFFSSYINPTLCYYSKPHQFRFKKFENEVLCHYKMWAVDEQYLPCEVQQTITVLPPDSSHLPNPPAKRLAARGVAKSKAQKKKV